MQRENDSSGNQDIEKTNNSKRYEHLLEKSGNESEEEMKSLRQSSFMMKRPSYDAPPKYADQKEFMLNKNFLKESSFIKEESIAKEESRKDSYFEKQEK